MTVDLLDHEQMTEKSSAPRLDIFIRSDGNVDEAAVIGDMVKVFAKRSDINKAFLVLIATSYVASGISDPIP